MINPHNPAHDLVSPGQAQDDYALWKAAKNSQPKPIDPWHALVFENTWGNYGGAYSEGRYRRDPFGCVHLTGLVTKAAGAGNFIAAENIFTLPRGYRPDFTLMFNPTVAGGGTYSQGRWDINTAGAFFCVIGGVANPVGWVNLEGITFMAVDGPNTY